jgi:hypothetical protein
MKKWNKSPWGISIGTAIFSLLLLIYENPRGLSISDLFTKLRA